MKNLSYSDVDLFELANSAIDKNENVKIAIPSHLSKTVALALKMHNQYFNGGSNGEKSRLIWLKFAFYALRSSPKLWGAINKADLNGYTVTSDLINDQLFILLKGPHADPIG